MKIKRLWTLSVSDLLRLADLVSLHHRHGRAAFSWPFLLGLGWMGLPPGQRPSTKLKYMKLSLKSNILSLLSD